MEKLSGGRGRKISRREMFGALAAAAIGGACAHGPRRTGLRFFGAALDALGGREELVLCGWDEVFALSLRGGEDPRPHKVWSWRAADCPGLPARLRTAFRTTDDCKPFDAGRRILISSSSGGVAFVERNGGRVLFYASVTNAHSAELLPGGRVVVAASVSSSPSGNRLVLFNIGEPDREIFSDRLHSAHGVVWDRERAVLWALGYAELRAYRLRNWRSAVPSLEREASFPLPDKGGHDLSPIPGTPYLFVSTGRRCWLFDRDRGTFAPHPDLADAERVKSCSVNAQTGRVAYVRAEGANWWAEHVRFLRPPGVLHLPGERLYKARWNSGA